MDHTHTHTNIDKLSQETEVCPKILLIALVNAACDKPEYVQHLML